MKGMNRRIGMLSAGFAFLGVILGAFGAHALKAMAEPLADGADRLRWWETGARYHLIHALALGLTAVVAHHVASKLPRLAAGLFVGRFVVFSGRHYLMGLTGIRGLGAITPIGGFLQLGGWITLRLAMRGLPEGKA